MFVPLFFFDHLLMCIALFQAICNDMWMSGCEQCLDKNKSPLSPSAESDSFDTRLISLFADPIPCDSLLVYSNLCIEMPDMAQCSAWSSLL